MAITATRPKCPKCAGSTFEMGNLEVRNSAYDYYSVQCTSCATIVGVLETHYISVLLDKIMKKLGVT